MTKRVLAGALCILLALALGAGGEWYLRNSAEGLLSAARVRENAEEAAVFDAAEATVRFWGSRQMLLGVILKHSDADELGKLFLEMKQALAARSAARCAAALERCRTEAEVLLKGERFSWENILHINGKIFLKYFTFINI